MIDLQQFKKDLEANTCPFCKKKLKFYDGSLGYEALRCYDCNLSIDHTGIHLDKLSEVN